MYWVFVDFPGGAAASTPRFWIVPMHWMRRDIFRDHSAYLESHGGRRPRSPHARHHAIDETRISEWRDRWDLVAP